MRPVECLVRGGALLLRRQLDEAQVAVGDDAAVRSALDLHAGRVQSHLDGRQTHEARIAHDHARVRAAGIERAIAGDEQFAQHAFPQDLERVHEMLQTVPRLQRAGEDHDEEGEEEDGLEENFFTLNEDEEEELEDIETLIEEATEIATRRRTK